MRFIKAPEIDQQTKEHIVATFKESSIILLYEMLGTAMMTLIITNYYSQTSLPTKQSNLIQINGHNQNITSYTPYKTVDNTALMLGMYVTITFSARISGSHFNPAITFSYMLGNVKSGKFDRILGIFYILAQFAGAFIGAILAKIYTAGLGPLYHGIILHIDADKQFSAILLEIIGGFIVVFMYLSSTEEKTKFTQDAAIQTLVLAGSYMAAMLLAGYQIPMLEISPINPAIASAIIVVHSSWTNSDDPTHGNWSSGYIQVFMSLIGSGLALIFYRYVYKLAQATNEQIDEEEQEEMAKDHDISSQEDGFN